MRRQAPSPSRRGFGCILIGVATLALPSHAGAAAPGVTEEACQRALAYSAARRGAALVVLHNGRIVCEGYSGVGSADRAMETFSGAKSFSGVMAAAAVQDGLLTLDEPVARTLPGWASDPAKRLVTLRQLLNLTSGLETRIGPAPGYEAATALPLSSPAGSHFRYGPAAFQVFGAVMRRKLAAAGRPSDPTAYLRDRILTPAGARIGGWRSTPEGDPILAQGAQFTARDWARFGEFVRIGGRVQGKSLVDEKSFREMFVGTAANPGYGLTWWLAREAKTDDPVARSSDLWRRAGEMPRDLVMAAGAGDQRLFVVPSLGLTIARLADFDPAAALARGAPVLNDPAQRWSDVDFVLTVIGRHRP